MKETYKIRGLGSDEGKLIVEQAIGKLSTVARVQVRMQEGEVDVDLSAPMPIEELQQALDGNVGGLRIWQKKEDEQKKGAPMVSIAEKAEKVTRVFYCPMQCEGSKTYTEPGNCPVCGMHLVEQAAMAKSTRYTCPMHSSIIRQEAGTCPICGMNLVPMEENIPDADKTYTDLLKKFKVALFFTIPIFLVEMINMMPNTPLLRWMDMRYWILMEMVFSIPVLFYAAWMVFERAWRSVVTFKLNMFTLIGIGAGVAWSFSVMAFFFPNIFPNAFKTAQGTVYVYFEASAVILTLVMLGQVLEARAHSRTKVALTALLKLAPNMATKIENGKENLVAMESIRKGDMLRVKPGEKIPVDGHILEGRAVIDESMISGEPVPSEMGKGDTVRAGTINGNSSFVMEADKVGADTLLAQIIHMVNEASRSKAPIQQLADKVSGYFVPIVMGISILSFVVWAIYGPQPSMVYAFVNAIAVLIIACPCALGLATPMSVMVAMGKGAQSGVLFKNAASLEKMNDIDILVIDKTGTITEGKPSVEKVIPLNPQMAEEDLLPMLLALNSQSEHPLSKAMMQYATEKHTGSDAISDFKAVTGKGVEGQWKGKRLALGNEKMMEQVQALISPELLAKATAEQQLGKTVSYLSEEKKAIAYVVIADKIKESSKEAIGKLQQEGMKVMMFTGDNVQTAKAVSDILHLDGFKAQMLPQDKWSELKRLQSEGKKLAMAGDGINDAPALSQADIGIAMGTGTDVAIESASITLLKGDLNGIVKARTLSQKTMKNIRENLFFAIGYNALGIPIAAGALYPFFGLLLSPMIAAIAMSFSSVSVITNALRLKKIKL